MNDFSRSVDESRALPGARMRSRAGLLYRVFRVRRGWTRYRLFGACFFLQIRETRYVIRFWQHGSSRSIVVVHRWRWAEGLLIGWNHAAQKEPEKSQYSLKQPQRSALMLSLVAGEACVRVDRTLIWRRVMNPCADMRGWRRPTSYPPSPEIA